jgi:hypothetical protein
LQDGADSWWKIGGNQGKGNAVQLLDDGLEHQVEIHIRS